jgi:hypothetical protein
METIDLFMPVEILINMAYDDRAWWALLAIPTFARWTLTAEGRRVRDQLMRDNMVWVPVVTKPRLDMHEFAAFPFGHKHTPTIPAPYAAFCKDGDAYELDSIGHIWYQHGAVHCEGAPAVVASAQYMGRHACVGFFMERGLITLHPRVYAVDDVMLETLPCDRPLPAIVPGTKERQLIQVCRPEQHNQLRHLGDVVSGTRYGQ